MMDNNNKIPVFFAAKKALSSVLVVISAITILSSQSLLAQPNVAESNASDPLAGKSVFEWLNTMAQTQKKSDYHGIFTYEYGAELASIEVWHGVKNGHEIERMIHLDGEPREVIRDQETLRCQHAGKKPVKVEQHDKHIASAKVGSLDIDKVKSAYNARYVGQYRVAGHPAVVVELTPKDAYRYGQRYFIGRDNNMLLKNILFDSKRRALERFQFTYLNMDANLKDADFQPQLPMAGEEISSQSSSLGNQPSQDDVVAWRLDWVPEGFEQVLGKSNNPTELMYSDGLAGFSVFVDQDAVSGSRSASSLLRGATLVYSRPLQMQGKTMNVTVVGEIPLAAAERIASGIEFSP